jgi:hypothetical protein
MSGIRTCVAILFLFAGRESGCMRLHQNGYLQTSDVSPQTDTNLNCKTSVDETTSTA